MIEFAAIFLNISSVGIFIPLYLGITLLIGLWASKKIKSSGDFMLAGRSLSTAFVGVTLFATWFGSGQIMGNPGRFLNEGFTAYVSLIITGGICLWIVGKYYAPKLYRMQIVTVGDFFRLRYNGSLDLAVSILMVLSYPHWIAAQFVALAYLFEAVMGVPFEYGVLLGATIVIVYTYIGGMWAVTYTDMLQSIMILIGLAILLYAIMDQSNGILPLIEDRSQDFYDLIPSGGIEEWSAYIALFLAFTAGAIPVQEIYQRVFSAKDAKSASNGLYLGAFLLVVIPSIPLLIAWGGAYLHPELLQGNGQNLIPILVNEMMGLPVQILFYGAIISAILSTSSGAMLAPATVIGENLIKPYSPNLSDKKLLLFTRLSVIGVAAVSCYFALDDADIVGLVEASLSLILVCVFIPFTFGLFWKKANVVGAWVSICAGGLVWLICYLIDTIIDPTIYGLIASLIGMIAGSLISVSFTSQKNEN